MQGANSNIIFNYFATFPPQIYGFFLTIYNLIQPEENQINDNHAADVVDFVNNFERKYGARRPAFLTTDYVTSINEVKTSLRFLLLYLHGDDHEDTDYFCRNTLCNSLFLDFLNNKSGVLFWGCNINSVEGFKVSKIVREHSYPFIGMITINDNNRMYLVKRQEGVMDVESLIVFITEALLNHSGGIRSCLAQREERNFNRVLRQQQEVEYAECLRIDQERELNELKENNLRVKITEERSAQLSKRKRDQSVARALLPCQAVHEAADNSRTVVVKAKFPSGSIVQRKFYPTDSIKLLYYWIFSSEECPENFSLFTNFPKKEIFCRPDNLELESDSIKRLPRECHQDPVTFTAAGLMTSTLLYVVENDKV